MHGQNKQLAKSCQIDWDRYVDEDDDGDDFDTSGMVSLYSGAMCLVLVFYLWSIWSFAWLPGGQGEEGREREENGSVVLVFGLSLVCLSLCKIF